MTSINGFRSVRTKISVPRRDSEETRDANLEVHVSVPHSVEAVRLNRLMDARDSAFDLFDVTQQRLEAARERLRTRDEDDQTGRRKRRRSGKPNELSGADLMSIMDEIDALTKAGDRAQSLFNAAESDMIRAAASFVNNIMIEQEDGSMDDLDFAVESGSARKPWKDLSTAERAAACSMLRAVILGPLFSAMIQGADVELMGK